VGGKLHGVFPDIVDMREPHPFSRSRQDDALADGVNEETMPDSLGDGMRPPGDTGLGNDPAYLVVHRLFALRPESLTGLWTGLSAAHVMHLIEQLEEGVGNGNGPVVHVDAPNLGLKDNGLAGEINLKRRQIERFREIAARVMQQAAKGLCRVGRMSRSGDKSLALLLAEELPPPLLIEQARPPRPFVSVRESRNGEGPLYKSG